MGKSQKKPQVKDQDNDDEDWFDKSSREKGITLPWKPYWIPKDIKLGRWPFRGGFRGRKTIKAGTPSHPSFAVLRDEYWDESAWLLSGIQRSLKQRTEYVLSTVKDFTPQILLFTSEQCAPCKMVSAMLDHINSYTFKDTLIIERINVEDNLALAHELGITALPTVIIGKKHLSANIEEYDVVSAILESFMGRIDTAELIAPVKAIPEAKFPILNYIYDINRKILDFLGTQIARISSPSLKINSEEKYFLLESRLIMGITDSTFRAITAGKSVSDKEILKEIIVYWDGIFQEFADSITSLENSAKERFELLEISWLEAKVNIERRFPGFYSSLQQEWKALKQKLSPLTVPKALGELLKEFNVYIPRLLRRTCMFCGRRIYYEAVGHKVSERTWNDLSMDFVCPHKTSHSSGREKSGKKQSPSTVMGVAPYQSKFSLPLKMNDNSVGEILEGELDETEKYSSDDNLIFSIKDRVSADDNLIFSIKDRVSADELDDYEQVDGNILAIPAGHMAVTRKFSLIPQALKNKVGRIIEQYDNSASRQRTISHFKDIFRTVIDIQNQFTQEFISDIRARLPRIPNLITRYADKDYYRTDPNHPSLASDSRNFYKLNFYNKIRSEFRTIHDRVITMPNRVAVKERVLYALGEHVYFALRNWFTRNEDLGLTSRLLGHIFQQQGGDQALKDFLEEGRLRREQLDPFYDRQIAPRPFFDNPFRNIKKLTHYWINNHIGQIKNILISREFQQRADTSAQTAMEAIVGQVQRQPQGSFNVFFGTVLNGFEHKVQGVTTSIPPEQLHEEMFTRYFAKVSRDSTSYAKTRLGLGNDKPSPFIRRYVDEIFADNNIQTFKEFEAVRNLEDHKAALRPIILQRAPAEFLAELHQLAADSLVRVLNDLSQSDSLLRKVFKPSFLPNDIMDISEEGFRHYLSRRLENKIRELVKNLLLDPSLITSIQNDLTILSREIYHLVKIPEFSNTSIPLTSKKGSGEGGVYDPYYNSSLIDLLFISNRAHVFRIKSTRKISTAGGIKNKKSILDEYINGKGYTTGEPTLTLKGSQLVLNLPFYIRKAPIATSNNIVGVDLGLKDWAVISVMDRTNPRQPKESARYFIDSKVAFDMKFNPETKQFEYLDIFRTLSNRTKDRNLGQRSFMELLGAVRVKPLVDRVLKVLNLNTPLNSEAIRRTYQRLNQLLTVSVHPDFETKKSSILAKLLAGGLVAYMGALKEYKKALMVKGEQKIRHPSLSFDAIANSLRIEDVKLLQCFFTKNIQSRYLRDTNIKFKLMKLRSEIRKAQRDRASLMNANPNYLHDPNYRVLDRSLTQLNNKVARINTEISHQVAHKIIEIAKAFNAVIQFEDLKWSRHSKKQDRGHWLAFWQQHWFFSKTIETTEYLGLREGIKVDLVDARYTSKWCWKDPKANIEWEWKGKANTTPDHPQTARMGKRFKCSDDNYTVDSDLNASRNIALRPIT